VTLKALGRMGVLSTAGWKAGLSTSSNRAIECIARHIHVHTHYARNTEVPQAMAYAEQHGWMPQLEQTTYRWDDIPPLAADFPAGRTESYFPVYQVNPV